MNSISCKVFALFLLCLITPQESQIQAQTVSENSHKQVSIQVHATAMVFLVAGINAELYTWERERSVTGISFGMGYYDEGIEFPVHFYTLWNKTSKHHMELDYGFNFIWNGGPLPLPTLAIGYRYQDLRTSGLVFRAGLNFGIIPYIGIGYAF